MDAYSFCWIALLKESDKCGIFFDKETAQSSIIPTFDLPINRLIYMYKCSSFIINLMNQCIFNTINYSASIAIIYNQICFQTDTRICSLSNGPGVEIVGLLYAFKNFIKPLHNISVDLVTKHKEWSYLSQLLMCGRLNSNSVSYNITDAVPKQFKIFNYNMADFTPDIKKSIMSSDVLMMVRSFEFEYSSGLDGFACVLKEILNLMKKDAILFFIDSKAKTKIFTDMNKNGMFLYGPKKVSVADVQFDKNHSEILGFTPDIQGTAHFALWKKASSSSNTLSISHQNINQNLVATSAVEKSNDSKTLVQTSISKSETTNKLFDEQVFKPEVLIINKGKMSSNSKDKLSETTNNISSEVSLQIKSSDKNNPLKISSPKSSDSNKQINLYSKSNPVVKESNTVTDKHVINNSHKSKNAQESQVNVMLERCEKLISVLETKIENISFNGCSESHSKTVDSNCSQKCAQKCCYNSHHQPMSAHVRYCASNHHCCHHCCCEPKIQCKSVSLKSTLPDTNMPYLVVPMPKSELVKFLSSQK